MSTHKNGAASRVVNAAPFEALPAPDITKGSTGDLVGSIGNTKPPVKASGGAVIAVAPKSPHGPSPSGPATPRAFGLSS